MLINGEKYACEACIRGHRVSNCQHSERKLQHINKKGRPVSQCQDCRAARKNRPAQIRCDCGEKVNKCIHLRPAKPGHRDTCCSYHGLSCSCAQKRDDQTKEFLPTKAKPRTTRKRANTTEGFVKDSNVQLQRANSANSTGNLQESRPESLRPMVSMASLNKSGSVSPQLTASPTLPSPTSMQLPHLDFSSIQYPSYSSRFPLLSRGSFPSRFHDEQPLFSPSLGGQSFNFDRFSTSHIYRQNTDVCFGSRVPTMSNTPTNSGNASDMEDFVTTNNTRGLPNFALASLDLDEVSAEKLVGHPGLKDASCTTLENGFHHHAFGSQAEDAMWLHNFSDTATTDSNLDSASWA